MRGDERIKPVSPHLPPARSFSPESRVAKPKYGEELESAEETNFSPEPLARFQPAEESPNDTPSVEAATDQLGYLFIILHLIESLRNYYVFMPP